MQFELFIHQCADPGGPFNQSINQSAVSNFSPGSDEPLFDWWLTFCFQASTNQLRRRICSLVFAAPKPDHLQQAHHATGLSTVSRSVVFLCFLVCVIVSGALWLSRRLETVQPRLVVFRWAPHMCASAEKALCSWSVNWNRHEMIVGEREREDAEHHYHHHPPTNTREQPVLW